MMEDEGSRIPSFNVVAEAAPQAQPVVVHQLTPDEEYALGNDGDDEDRVMVGRFQSPTEAQMARGMLESAGIECFLQGENANALLPLAFRARLTVAHADESAARALMASAGSDDNKEDELG